MGRGKTIHFLLTYDRSERRLVNMERFHNGRKAVDAYGEREREFAHRPHIEVVLLGADSESDLFEEVELRAQIRSPLGVMRY